MWDYNDPLSKFPSEIRQTSHLEDGQETLVGGDLLILDNEITRARFAVHLELTESRLILDNEITRASIRCPL